MPATHRIYQILALAAMVILLGRCEAQSAGPPSKTTSTESASEIHALFVADQADRDFGAKAMGTPEQMREIMKNDVLRRKRAHELLQAGALKTAQDYEDASFIFQHSDQPQDYLLAHILAVVAVAKGDQKAVWISAATLDRYLNSIKQPQVLGTQFNRPSDKSPWTQDPYDRNLVPDAVRKELCVHSDAEQKLALELLQQNKEPDLPPVCPDKK